MQLSFQASSSNVSDPNVSDPKKIRFLVVQMLISTYNDPLKQLYLPTLD